MNKYQRTMTWFPPLECPVVAGLNGIPPRADGVVVGAKDQSDFCKTAHFEIESCDCADCAAANDENLLFGSVGHFVRVNNQSTLYPYVRGMTLH